MRRHPLAPLVIVVAAIGCGRLFVSGPEAALAFGLLGLLAGATLRSWRALPLLACGLLLGATARILNDPGWTLTNLRPDRPTILALGKGAFGLLMGHGVLTILLAAPVAAGRWLATPRPPRTLRTWRG